MFYCHYCVRDSIRSQRLLDHALGIKKGREGRGMSMPFLFLCSLHYIMLFNLHTLGVIVFISQFIKLRLS